MSKETLIIKHEVKWPCKNGHQYLYEIDRGNYRTIGSFSVKLLDKYKEIFNIIEQQ